MNQVDVLEEQSGTTLILRIKGRLDAITSPPAEKKILETINRGERNILLNFEGVDYLSSAGMRTLLVINKRLSTQNGRLVISSITPYVMDVLKMSGFDHVLQLAKDDAEGLKKINSPKTNG
jgi:anti-sigma B factor antagonist/stage II sporulation protein AA (anti-sigma F factor antagonist)